REDRLCEGGHAVRHITVRNLRASPASECRAAVRELPLHREGAAADRRQGRDTVGPPGCKGTVESHAALADQAAGGRSGGHAPADRGDQEALYGALRQLSTQAFPSSIALPRRDAFDWTKVVSVAFVGLLAVLVLLPMGWLAATSVRDNAGGLTLDHYRQ